MHVAGSVVLPNDVHVSVVERDGEAYVEVSRPGVAPPDPDGAKGGPGAKAAPKSTAQAPRLLVAGSARVHLLEGSASRWQTRLLAYHASLVDRYPPFAFDSGPAERAPRDPASSFA